MCSSVGSIIILLDSACYKALLATKTFYMHLLRPMRASNTVLCLSQVIIKEEHLLSLLKAREGDMQGLITIGIFSSMH